MLPNYFWQTNFSWGNRTPHFNLIHLLQATLLQTDRCYEGNKLSGVGTNSTDTWERYAVGIL